MLEAGRRGLKTPEDGSSTTTDEIDADFLKGLAAEVAQTEEELHLLRGR